MKKNRLSKILAAAGVASRRKCEELIFNKRVYVNGTCASEPQQMVDVHKDHIVIDGKRINYIEPKIYYVLNKPKGYTCTHNRDRTNKIAVDLVPPGPRLFTVGRLDRDTTGLLIITNDGHFANHVMHPRYKVQKEYLVKTNSDVLISHLEQMSAGVSIEGSWVKPVKVTKVRKNTIKIVVQDGKKREVRQLVEQTGLQVLDLCRIRIGNLRLGQLEEGYYKQVTLEELESAIN